MRRWSFSQSSPFVLLSRSWIIRSLASYLFTADVSLRFSKELSKIRNKNIWNQTTCLVSHQTNLQSEGESWLKIIIAHIIIGQSLDVLLIDSAWKEKFPSETNWLHLNVFRREFNWKFLIWIWVTFLVHRDDYSLLTSNCKIFTSFIMLRT